MKRIIYLLLCSAFLVITTVPSYAQTPTRGERAGPPSAGVVKHTDAKQVSSTFEAVLANIQHTQEMENLKHEQYTSVSVTDVTLPAKATSPGAVDAFYATVTQPSKTVQVLAPQRTREINLSLIPPGTNYPYSSIRSNEPVITVQLR